MPLSWLSVRNWFRGPLPWTCVAIAGCLWDGWLFIGPFFGYEPTDRWSYAGWVFAGTVLSAGGAMFNLYRENTTLKAETQPRLQLVYEKNGQLFDSMHHNNTLRIFRVGVVNSGESVLEVAVKVSRISPELPRVFPMQELQQTHEEDGVSRFTVNKSDEPLVFVDLIWQYIHERDGIARGAIGGVEYSKAYRRGQTYRMEFAFADGPRDFKTAEAHPTEEYSDLYLIWLAIDGAGAGQQLKLALKKNPVTGQHDLSVAFA